MILKFLFLIVIAQTEAVDIDCKFYALQLNAIGIQYVCEAQNLSVTSTDTKIDQIIGIHQPGLSNDDVTLVIIEDEIFSYFPINFSKKLSQNFRNLIGLTISNSQLKKVSQSDLMSFNYLMYLMLDGNEIEELQNGVFNDNQQLQYVSMSFNRIKIIGNQVFDELKQLSGLYLVQNVCVSSLFEDKAKMAEFIQEVYQSCDGRQNVGVFQLN